MGLDGGCGGEDESVCVPVALVSHLDDGVDDAGDRDGDGGGDLGQGEGGGGVACDYELVCALLMEEFCAVYCVACDGGLGFGSVGETCGVAQIDVVGCGDERKQGSEDGEAAEAGIKDAYGGALGSRESHLWGSCSGVGGVGL